MVTDLEAKRIREQQQERDRKREQRENPPEVFKPSENKPRGGSGELTVDKSEAGTGVALPNGQQLFFRDPTEANVFINRQAQKAQLPGGAVSQGAVTEEQQRVAGELEAVQPFVEARRPTLEEGQIDIAEPTGIGGTLSKAPAVGFVFPVVQEILANLGRTQEFLTTNKEDIDTPIQDPQTAREVALREIQQREIAKGITAGEAFGALVESIPVVGSLAGSYATGLIEDPKGNVNTLVTEIASERERASVIAEKIGSRVIPQQDGIDMINEIEENIARAEGRIKLLAQGSAALRADADSLNKIEEQILRSKERVFIAKQIAVAAVAKPLTDSELLLALNDIS